MSRTILIIMERSGDWAVALRSRLDRSQVRLFETRTLEECLPRIEQHPAALVALELTAANARSVITLLLRLQSELPEARAIVVAQRELAAYEDLVREAGAIHFVVSPRSLGDVAEFVRRRGAEQESLAARAASDADNPRAAILANLPWSDMI